MTCIAVKEDRHQNLMSSVVPKRGIEEPWASERVARFTNSLVYKEITLKSDTELAIIAVRNRVAEKQQNRGHAGGRGQRRQTSKRTGRKRSDAAARRHQNHQVPCGVLHARRTPKRLPNLAVVGGTCGEHPVQVSEGVETVETVGRHSKDCMTRKSTQEFVPFGEKVPARAVSSEPLKNTSSECGWE